MDNIFVAITFSLLTNVAVAAEGEWEIQRDEEDIQVYTRSVEGSP